MSGKIEIGKRMVAVVMAKRKAPVERSSETPRDEQAQRPRREKRRGGETTETEGRGGGRARVARRRGGWWSARARRGRANSGDRGIETRGEIEGVDAGARRVARGGELESIAEPCPEDVMKVAKIREDGCKRRAVGGVQGRGTARKAVERCTARRRNPKSKTTKRKSTNDHAADDENDEPEEKVWARMLAGEGSKPKQWRVIVRNLSFKATKAAIREAGCRFRVGHQRSDSFHNKPKGFAFITYTCKADADRAVSDCNGVTYPVDK